MHSDAALMKKTLYPECNDTRKAVIAVHNIGCLVEFKENLLNSLDYRKNAEACL